MNDVFAKLAAGGSSSYSPTQVDPSKYRAVTQGRNTFLAVLLGVTGVVGAAYAIPNIVVRRYSTALFRTHCRGRVLDLVPKLGDTASVGLFEASPTVRVEFLVDERVFDDGNYRIDESTSETQQEEKRKAMTLEHMCQYDPLWVTSPVTFAVASRPEVAARKMEALYDTVVVRHGLCNLDDEDVKKVVSEGLELLKPGGHFLLIEVGAGTIMCVNRAIRWIHRKVNTSMFLSRHYDTESFAKRSDLELVTFKRQLLGHHYTMAWLKKT
jgi:SAM-dependent methyltransferase